MRLLALFLALAWAPSSSVLAAGSSGGSYFDDADELPTPGDGTDPFGPGARPPYPIHRAKATLVDLHAHVFEHGLGFLSSGDFRDPSLNADWDSRWDNKVNEEALEASGLGLVVVALYAHPILSVPAKVGLRRQIAKAHAFVRSHPDWMIARNAAQARRAYANGKRILVLSIEGASPALETEADIREFVDRRGVSIVTFAHLTDDGLAGAALMSGYQVLSNPLAEIRAAFLRRHGEHGEHLNDKGLTAKGARVAASLIRRGVWIDLAHASERTERRLGKMVEDAGQPFLYTHTALRKYNARERLLSEAQLRKIAATGGILGIVPGESAIGATVVPPRPGRNGSPVHCKGGVFALAEQFNAMARVVGPSRVFIGSDFNGAMDHLRPSARQRAGQACALGSTIDREGLNNISQTGELWQDLGSAGAVSRENQRSGVEHFLEAWSRVRPRKAG